MYEYIIIECIVLCLVYWVVYHIWFASKDNDLQEVNSDQQSAVPISDVDIEDEQDDDRQELETTFSQLITDAKAQEDPEYGNEQQASEENESLPVIPEIDENIDEGDEGQMVDIDDVEPEPVSFEDSDDNTGDPFEGKPDKTFEAPQFEDDDDLDQVPSMEYLKES